MIWCPDHLRAVPSPQPPSVKPKRCAWSSNKRSSPQRRQTLVYGLPAAKLPTRVALGRPFVARLPAPPGRRALASALNPADARGGSRGWSRAPKPGGTASWFIPAGQDKRAPRFMTKSRQQTGQPPSRLTRCTRREVSHDVHRAANCVKGQPPTSFGVQLPLAEGPIVRE